MVATPDGRRLRAMVDGPDGDTLVVLEAGLGVGGIFWTPVYRLLSPRFRVVAYNRAGIDGSDPAPGPRTLEALAADLQAVIDHFPHQRVILAAHSWGGPVIRVAAARRLAAGAHELAGLVLADQSDEHDPLFFSVASRRQFAAVGAAMSALAPVAPLARKMLRGTMAQVCATPQSMRAFAAEIRIAIHELGWLLEHPPDLGELPVRVLSGQLMSWFDKRNRTELIGGHRKTATALAGGRYVPAYRSGHLIPLTEPELIAEHIGELAQAG
jgi:pimeloyl-ACP methyl ester carboxylesterase